MQPAVPEAGTVAFRRQGQEGLLGVVGDVPLPPDPPTTRDAIDTGRELTAVSPIGHAIIVLSIIVPTFVLVSAFSVAGWGDVTYIGLASWDAPWYAAAAVDVVLLVVLWTFDAPSWTRPALVLLRRVCVLLLIAFILIACSLMTKVYPFAPLQVSLLLIPACCFASRHFLLPSSTSSSVFLASLSNSLLAVAGLLTLYFVLWVFALSPPDSRIRTGWQPEWVNIWGGDVKQYWRTRLGCEPCVVPCNATEIANDSDCYSAAFLWWFFPLLIVISLLLFAAASRVLSRMLADSSAADAVVTLFLGVVAIAGFGLYAAAEVAGAGMGLSDLVVVSMVCLVGSSLALIGGTLGWNAFSRSIAAQPWARRWLGYLETVHEWCLALVICVAALPIGAYLCLSAIKQATRKARGSSRAHLGGLLTGEASARVRHFARVHWGSVASKVAILCLIYLTLFVVVSKVVVVLLTWLSWHLAEIPLFATCTIFLVVGIIMFLCPFIPGFPVYVCAGVLIPRVAMDQAGDAEPGSPHAPPSFWGGFLLACALASALKLIALVIQQEVFGRRLGERVAIRAWCQVNSTFIQAARFVLTQPGCTFGKTMILCGGPDWPTSVLTGILRLSVTKMLIGTLPVVFVIIPCTALGACLFMTNRPGWDGVSRLMAIIAAGTQLGVTIGTLAVIERATSVHAKAIAALPIDEEVAALADAQAARAHAWRAASDWRRPGYPRVWIATAATAAIVGSIACHLTIFVRCFVSVTVADDFFDAPLNGNPFAVVNGAAGVIVVVAFVLSSVLLYIHNRWLEGQLSAAMRAAEQEAATSTELQEQVSSTLPGAGMGAGAVGDAQL